MDTTKKFDGLAADYAASRPNYAKELINYLYGECGFSTSSVIADIGSGTGKFAVHLLERGSTVYCVEPNDDMRSAAERELQKYAGFRSVNGGAEDTTLAAGTVDFVTTAQAFHWFDTARFGKECQRILKKGGRAVLVWNVRDGDDLPNKELHSVFSRFCPDFNGFSGGMTKDDPRIKAFFGGGYERVAFDNPLYLDHERFISRCLSGSYSLKAGDRDYCEYMETLHSLFDRLSENGIVRISNSSVAYIGNVE